MKSLGKFFADVFKGSATSETPNLHNEWARARADAARFGPSHVAEIDAIFSRQS